MNIDVPFLNALQFMSYLTPSICIFGLDTKGATDVEELLG
jgi:hypothetical protein